VTRQTDKQTYSSPAGELSNNSYKTFCDIYDDCLFTCLQCFDAVGWVAGRASGL